MRRLGGLLALVLAAALPMAARGQDRDDPDSGEQPGDVTPPAPDGPDAPKIHATNPDERHAIRGADPEDEPEDDPQQKALHEWEQKTFPQDDTSDAADDHPRPHETIKGKDELPADLRSPQAGDPAPAKLVTADTKPEDVRPDLPWLKGLKIGDIAVRWDPRVIKYLEYYRDDPNGQTLMKGWLAAQGRFRKLIYASLKKHHLPEDLIYLCMIESSYDPWDYSRVGASGLWQFMPAGGRVYGLNQDFWVDERNDPERSTEAAALYWKDLHDRFGTWDLAMAAYNAGYGAVLKSIAKYNTNDFWALLDLEGGLPWGSSIYVPKALATMIVGHNRDAFGFGAVVDEPEWTWDRVTVPTSVALSVIARAAGVTENDVAWLNPELRRGRTPPGVKDYVVRIPAGKKEQFAKTFAQLRGDWDGYDAYLVRWGERFEDIARIHGVAPQKLRELNGVTDVSEVHGGLTIVVPHVDDATKEKNRKAAEADLYHSDVAPGGPDDPMIVAVPDKDLVVDGKKRVFYRVVGGDTLEDVAKVLGVRLADLAAWNHLDRDANIQPRMVIVAYVDPSFDADQANVALLDDARLALVTSGSKEHIELVEGRKGRKRTTYTVKKGDTLESIGKPHHLSKFDMARINRRSYNAPVTPGEQLIIYVVVDVAKARKAGVFDTKKRKLEPPVHPKAPKHR